MRRLGIYFFCDKDGIVDEYNLVLLKDLKDNLDRLLVVCNGELTPEGKAKFETVADEVLVRENRGLDVWAYKEGMAHFGWQRLGEYDELVLLNFTNFGPVYPFSEMFAEMSRRKADFWGIVLRHGFLREKYRKCKYESIPDHIPLAFLVVRKSLICSKAFQNYWDEMPEINSREDAVCYHEAIFTCDFAAQGFTYDLYIKTEDLKGYWDDPLTLYPLELIKNRRCPVFKRESFFDEYEEFFSGSCGEATAELYEYLRQESRFDVNLIWDNLLRTANMSDLKDRMQLNYILPKAGLKPGVRDSSRIALLMHVYYEDQLDWCCDYAANMPPQADIYISTDSERKRQLIETRFSNLKCGRLQVNLVENRGRDVSALLIGFKNIVRDYEYICFAHDKKTTHVSPLLIGQSFAYKCFENILASQDFVKNVVRTFEENPRLGLLSPPPPQHSVYFQILGHEWGNNFENTVKLAERMNLRVDMDENKVPVAPLGTMFWFRPQALKKLFDHGWTYEDFPAEPTGEVDGNIMHAIERIYPFAAQSAGFFSAWLLTDQFARWELTNLNYIAQGVRGKLNEKDGIIAVLNRDIGEKDRFIGILHQRVAEKDEVIALLHHSAFFRLREFMKRIIPPTLWNYLAWMKMKCKI